MLDQNLYRFPKKGVVTKKIAFFRFLLITIITGQFLALQLQIHIPVVVGAISKPEYV